MKKGIVYALVLCLIFGGCLVPAKGVSATSFKFDAFNIDGRVTNITGKKLTYRRQTGSSPESWARPKSVKVTASTKFYLCKGYNTSYTKYKAKKVARKKAINAIYNNGSNYVNVFVKGNKAVRVMYGMENYVG